MTIRNKILASICKKETQNHIEQVNFFMKKSALEIEKRGKIHDASKLKEPEFEYFKKYTPLLKNVTYGSKEYNEYLKNLKIALDHHYKENSHHPEHYSNGIARYVIDRFT